MLVLVCLITMLGFAAAIWRLVWTTGQPAVIRIGEALVPLCGAAVVLMFLVRFIQVGTGDWNEAKLGPIVAMTKGYALYQDPYKGVMTAWIYGPVGALVLLPAALGKDPTTVAIIGSGINAFCILAPAAWLFAQASRGRARLVALLAFMAFVWELIYYEALLRCTFIASSDGPALGLATCACAAIYLRRTHVTMAISAAAAILCFWTKQTYVPLGAALIIYIAIVDGVKTAGIYAAMMAAIGVAVSAVLLASFGGVRTMYFHMVTLPNAHPYRDIAEGYIVVWYRGIRDLILACGENLGLLFVVLVMDHLIQSAKGASPRGIRAWFVARPWSMLLPVALSAVPGSLASYLIAGGFLNSLGYTDFFVLIAAMAGGIEVCAAAQGDEPAIAMARQFVRSGFLAFVLVMGLVTTLAPRTGLDGGWKQLMHPYDNVQQEAFAYIQEHKDQVYCPWDPLTTLLADGKLYHFEWGGENRGYAKIPITAEQAQNHLPRRIKLVVYFRVPESMFMQQAMESALHRKLEKVELPELPHCIVYKL